MIKYLARLAAVAAAVPLGLIAASGAAMAATSGQHISPPGPGTYVYFNYRAVNVQNQGNFSGDWTLCGHGINDTNNNATFTCTETVTSSTTVQVNATYTAADISTALGFSISHTYTYSTSLGLTITLNPDTQADIDFGTYYAKIYAGIENQRCVISISGTHCYAWSSPTYMTEQKALSPAIKGGNVQPYP
jgi:hypothetical protein